MKKSLKNNSSELNIIIIGAGGAVAGLMIDTLIEFNASIIGVDIKDTTCIKKNLTEYYQINISNNLHDNEKIILEKLENADYVLLCLPENVAINLLSVILSHLKKGCVLVDTLSVKKNYFNQLAALQNGKNTIETLSINLLFKPSLGFKKNNLAIIQDNCGEKSINLLQCLERKGANIVYCSIDEHDKIMSIIQVLPHVLLLAFGLTLSESNYPFKKLLTFLTPPFKAFLSLLARIITSEPHIYFDIQVKNSFAKNIRKNLNSQLKYLNDLIANDDQLQFRHVFEILNSFFGEDILPLAKYSEHLLNPNSKSPYYED